MGLTIKDIVYLREELTDFWGLVYDSNGLLREKRIDQLFELRGYRADTKMRDILKQKNVVHTTSLFNNIVLKNMKEYEKYKTKEYWGIFKEDYTSGLDNRWVLPIRDFSGLITGFVGWSPEKPKYYITQTEGFSRETQFFGAEDYDDYLKIVRTCQNEPVYIVEGIFDALAIKSLGLCSMSNMGLSMSAVKKVMLERFRKVVFIPDGDAAGRKALPQSKAQSSMLREAGVYVGKGQYDTGTWNCRGGVPVKYLELKGDGKIDMDFLINKTDIDLFEIKKELVKAAESSKTNYILKYSD